jgi:hypothetical protein
LIIRENRVKLKCKEHNTLNLIGGHFGTPIFLLPAVCLLSSDPESDGRRSVPNVYLKKALLILHKVFLGYSFKEYLDYQGIP